MPGRLIAPLREFGRRAADRVSTLSPAHRKRLRESKTMRAVGLEWLADYSRRSAESEPRFGCILVDGQWDNANFWLRYALLRRALGFISAREIGVLGQHNRERVLEAFTAFGFSGVADFGGYLAESDPYRPAARNLLISTKSSTDILSWRLPHDFPPALVYDGILKRQRRAEVDVQDPRLLGIVAEALSAIAKADELVQHNDPDLVVLSHTIDFTYGSLAHAALRRGIPVFALYGDYGTNRFLRLESTNDLFSYPGRPTLADEDTLTPLLRAALVETGRRFLDDRLNGRTSDVSAIYSYRRRRGHVDRQLCAARYKWDAEKPIVAVYAPNWFDYPNGSGRLPFRDFLHWAEVTIAAARENSAVNWLFKAHPCDEWYGAIRGPRLADLIHTSRSRHVQLCDASWNGRALLETVDALVTVHGTAGIEAASLGKPVLLPYSGWYGSFGFAQVAETAEDYIRKLHSPWWRDHDPASAADRAAAFAAWCFCAPDWHAGWFLSDDANQDAIWWDLDAMFEAHPAATDREVEEIRAWIDDGHRYFHIFKMRRTNGFAPAHPYLRKGALANEDPRRRQLDESFAR